MPSQKLLPYQRAPSWVFRGEQRVREISWAWQINLIRRSGQLWLGRRWQLSARVHLNASRVKWQGRRGEVMSYRQTYLCSSWIPFAPELLHTDTTKRWWSRQDERGKGGAKKHMFSSLVLMHVLCNSYICQMPLVELSMHNLPHWLQSFQSTTLLLYNFWRKGGEKATALNTAQSVVQSSSWLLSKRLSSSTKALNELRKVGRGRK